MTRAVAGVWIAVMATALAAAPAAAQDRVTVPMLDYGGRPVIELTINGAGPYRVIVDTGATNSVLDPSMTGGGTGPVTLKTLAVGSLKFDDVNVNSNSVFGGGAVPADFPKGVLSAAQFPGYLMTFDFPAKTLTIAKGALPAADGKRIFQYGADQVLPVAPIRVAGHEYVIHVDTGSPVGVMLPLRYSKEVPLDGELKLVGKARTVAGEFEMFTATVTGTIEIGAFPIADHVVRFSDLRPGPQPGIGNMGSALLKDFRLTFDAANRRLRFEKP
jgi:hypothetical protein